MKIWHSPGEMDEEILLSGTELDALIETIASASHTFHQHKPNPDPPPDVPSAFMANAPPRASGSWRPMQVNNSDSCLTKSLKRRRQEVDGTAAVGIGIGVGAAAGVDPPYSPSSLSPSSSLSSSSNLPIPMPMRMSMQQQHKAWRRQEQVEQAHREDHEAKAQHEMEANKTEKSRSKYEKRPKQVPEGKTSKHENHDDFKATVASTSEDTNESDTSIEYGKESPTESKKKEMMHLKMEIQRLQAQLESLHLAANSGLSKLVPSDQNKCKNTIMAAHSTDAIYPHSMALFCQLQQDPVRKWRHIAANQCLGRQQSEAENEELRRQVRRHGRIIKDMQSQLARKLRSLYQCTESALSLQPRDLVRKWDAKFVDELFDLLTAQSFSLDTQLDQVFDQCGLTHQNLPMQNARLVPTNSNSTSPFYIEKTEVIHYPFDQNTTFEALWKAFDLCNLSNATRRTFDGPEPDDLRYFSVFLPMPEVEAVNPGQLVFRRFLPDSNGRILIAWKGFGQFESLVTGNKLFSILETGWWTIEDLVTANGTHGSKLKLCAQTVPIWDADPMNPAPKLSQKTMDSLLQRFVQKFFHMNHQFFEGIEMMIRANGIE